MTRRKVVGSQADPIPSDFVNLLLTRGREAGLELSAGQAELLCRHVALMLEWNRGINLTRITRPEDILTRHLLDSMIPGRWLPPEGKMLDVGSGAGFPGVPLKILHPDAHVTLVESHRKKISFLKVLRARLGVRGLEVLPSRWEDVVPDPSRGLMPRWSVITMRAVRLEGRHLKHLAGRLLGPGGIFAFWAGAQGASVVGELAGEAESAGLAPGECLPYHVPGLDRARCLLLWKREA
jgi:16S rRNA (guanine527-N7)-methyltransferase